MSTSQLYSRLRITRESADLQRLYPLIIDYIHHPDHATSVTEFVFKCHAESHDEFGSMAGSSHGQDYTQTTNSTVQNVDTIRQALRTLDLEAEEEEKWLSHLNWMQPEVVAARAAQSHQSDMMSAEMDAFFGQCAGTLLLMLCPNITTLTYEDNYGPMESVLLRNNYDRLPAKHLQKLQTVKVLPRDDSMNDPRFYNFIDVLYVFRMFHRLPSVEEFIADGFTVNNDAGFIEEFPAASSNVKSIQLRHTELPTIVAGAIIRMSRHLEDLTLTHGGRANPGSGYYMRYLKTIAQAVGCHKSTLRQLDLDMDHFYRYSLDDDRPVKDAWDEEEEEDEEDRDEFSAQDEEDGAEPLHVWELAVEPTFRGVLELQDFNQLTHLSIGIQSLLGPPIPDSPIDPPVRMLDSLPPNLESLTIRGYERGKVARFDAEIDSFLAEKAVQLPALKLIKGIDALIPNGKHVENPDTNKHLLWQPDEEDEDWTESPAKRQKHEEL